MEKECAENWKKKEELILVAFRNHSFTFLVVWKRKQQPNDMREEGGFLGRSRRQ